MFLEEFEQLREGPPYFDYINGEAIEVNRPTGKHQDIEGELSHVLRRHVRKYELGRLHHKIDVKLPNGNWVGPDIVFISTEHLDRYDEQKGDLYGAPDLVVEISSPSTWGYDRIEKMDEYHLADVPWVWIVEQESLTIEENQWTAEGYVRIGGARSGQVFRPRLFPGLEIDLATLLKS
jgi:Uma2 family endonuclease